MNRLKEKLQLLKQRIRWNYITNKQNMSTTIIVSLCVVFFFVLIIVNVITSFSEDDTELNTYIETSQKRRDEINKTTEEINKALDDIEKSVGINSENNKNSYNNSANESNINVPLEKINALKTAKNYLSLMPFSLKGLVEQLRYEGFGEEQIMYAIDYCGADWNEQAAKKAKEYLNVMPFSKQRLIEQLEFEGFTHEQAVYGAEANGY